MEPRSAPPAYEEVIPHQNRYKNSILTPAYRVYPINTVQPHSTVTPILHLNTPYPIQTFQSGPNFTPAINQNSIYQVQTYQTTENFQANAVTHLGFRADMAVRIGDRLIIDFEKLSCCMFEKSGLHPQVKHNIPTEIKSKEITPQIWMNWMSELDEIQQMAPSVCGCLMLFCVPCGVMQSILCATLCPLSMNHQLSWLPCCYGDWYEALRQWMNELNASLSKIDMYAKFMTYKPYNNAPRSRLYTERIDGKDQHYEMSFLVISLTAEESVRLQMEHWAHGIESNCRADIGRCV